ncbi:peptidoglycan editing factor PgeF [Erythrobacter ani]|uniref:Purine nucleoside phosphorylase n=1 Tax=Erythrobacter ani TaxID=2827235 RepID=A0ABS6SL39_9SPHN|nr:peptidoglycan editing factor PgeF [Erythrobacter ani]MBV7265735.1 peptidoglycan editing factor PgeF [Erythrobacter ani]
MADLKPFDIATSDVHGGMPHGFFGSGGGLHQFGFGGPGEERDIRKLRAAAADHLVESAAFVAPHQVHSPDVVTVPVPWPDAAEGRPVADALVTSRPNIVLGIVTADCAPVLFADARAGVIGAAHAGWRGAHGGVLANTVAAMEALGAERENISAAIGPTIAQRNYEVDAAFRKNFGPEDELHFKAAPMREGQARWHFDLPGYINSRLREAGLIKIEDAARDTFSNFERYYSYRRATQRGEPNYGRQISMIGMR